MQSLLDYAESIEESSNNSGAEYTSFLSPATGSAAPEQPVLTADASSSAIISLSELRRRTQSFIIQHVAESGEGNSPNAALKYVYLGYSLAQKRDGGKAMMRHFYLQYRKLASAHFCQNVERDIDADDNIHRLAYVGNARQRRLKGCT